MGRDTVKSIVARLVELDTELKSGATAIRELQIRQEIRDLRWRFDDLGADDEILAEVEAMIDLETSPAIDHAELIEKQIEKARTDATSEGTAIGRIAFAFMAAVAVAPLFAYSIEDARSGFLAGAWAAAWLFGGYLSWRHYTDEGHRSADDAEAEIRNES